MRRAAPLVLAVLLFAGVGIVWITTDRRASERVFDTFSSANTSDEGLSQARAYLARRGPVSILTRPLARQPLGRDAVVIRMTEDLPLQFDPEELEGNQVGPPRPKERPLLSDEEDAFVRSGGRMIIGAHAGLLPSSETEKKTAAKVFPVWPGVERLETASAKNGFVTLRPRMHTLFSAGKNAIVARERIGDGDLFVIAWPDLFQNGNLARADHLALLAALAGKRPVYFDEVVHGMVSGDGSLELMKEWNLGPLLVLLVLLAALIFWRAARRIGEPEEETREVRSDAIDLVRSLAALYREVTRPAEAVRLYHDSLTRTVAHTTGLRGDALRERVRTLTGGRHTLAGINDAFAALTSQSRKVSKSRGRKAGERA